MQEKDSQNIALGPGGLILNVKANKKLLEKIRGTEPLPSPDLIYLANFFRRYKTDVPLGDHLELVALRQFIYKPDVQKALITSGYAANSIPTLDLLEKLEPEDWNIRFPDPHADGGKDENTGDPPEPFIDRQLAQVAWISFSGVGLLIEIAYYRAKDGNRKKRYYVIGVSPDPGSLQPDAQGQVSRVHINKEVDPARNEQD